MPKKRKPNSDRVAGELAAIALRYLKNTPEEEQERCIIAAESRLNLEHVTSINRFPQ